MAALNDKSISHRLFLCGTVLSLAWFAISVSVVIKFAKAQDQLEPIPPLLKFVYEAIAFPVGFPPIWEWLRTHLGDQQAMILGLFNILVNSICLGFSFAWCALSWKRIVGCGDLVDKKPTADYHK